MDTIEITNEKSLLDRRRPWRRKEYDRAAEAGIFGATERLELIDGEIIQKMTHNTPHATSISLCADALRQAFTVGFHVRVQLPLALGEWSEPEPDIAVVVGTARDYEEVHPFSAVLVVEISDTTLRMDRETKASLYASAGIAEYWILNLNSRILEIYRNAGAQLEGGGYMYTGSSFLTESELVTPLAAPDNHILVSDLLPRRRV